MNNKKRVILLCALCAILLSLLFIVIQPITALFLISYLFALIGLAILCGVLWLLFDEKKSYPWIAALPKAVLSYLAVSFTISVVVVLLEQLSKWNETTSSPGIAGVFQRAPGWYFGIHAGLLLLLIIGIVILRGGQNYIEARDQVVKKKVFELGQLNEDLQTLLSKANDEGVRNELGKLIDAVRYSDPMSADQLLPLEEKIKVAVQELSAAMNSADIQKQSLLLQEVSHLLEERNRKCKLFK